MLSNRLPFLIRPPKLFTKCYFNHDRLFHIQTDRVCCTYNVVYSVSIVIRTFCKSRYRNESRNTADHYGVLERFFVHFCWFWNQLKALLYTFHTLEWMKSCVKKNTSRNDRATVTTTAISYTDESKHARYQHNNKQPTHNFFAIQSLDLHTFILSFVIIIPRLIFRLLIFRRLTFQRCFSQIHQSTQRPNAFVC